MSSDAKARRPVLATVAALARVSVPTVSKVINGREDVADETRIRVQAALDELGYVSPFKPRVPAEGPIMVDFVVNGVASQYSHALMTGLLDYANFAGVEVVVTNTSEADLRSANHEAWARRMSESGRKGLILATPNVDASLVKPYGRLNIPVVVIDPWSAPQVGCITVGATNWSGGKAAVEHLIGLGHTKIAFIGGDPASESSNSRLHGYLAALRNHGIEARPEYVLEGEFGSTFGAEATRRLLALKNPPTAVFAVCDYTAVGVLQEGRRQGLRLPEDLSVVGFDGLPVVEQTLPRLTSVAQPLHDMGRAALGSVLRLIRGEQLDSAHVELATALQIRDSTTAPPGVS
ncbi:LacI family DNA-binding transcriptional regulator [Arthrobacter sp. 35W]|uniref:LacI family DNA-binding transcriptional regulator n=1 Tax=Arthrobacter sp. 35W TaxID=1132441 RepID=UPI000479569B|nr:LacI family DNA-binding transcriptional regulator [Arthrobacter sp. 35W]